MSTQKNTTRICNTKDSDTRKRSRNWCFTINNFDIDDINSIKNSNGKYIFQEEKGENGTPHLQGFISFKDAKSFTWIKKLNGKAHWEVTKSKIASIKYCSKESTRIGSIYTNMDDVKTPDEITQVTQVPLSVEEKVRQHLEDYNREQRILMFEGLPCDGFDLPDEIFPGETAWKKIATKLRQGSA